MGLADGENEWDEEFTLQGRKRGEENEGERSGDARAQKDRQPPANQTLKKAESRTHKVKER